MKYDLISRLTPLAEPDYRDFHVRLVPELDADGMLGVRMPALRALGKELARGPDVRVILDDRTPDRYYEETVVRGGVNGCAVSRILCRISPTGPSATRLSVGCGLRKPICPPCGSF